MNYYCLVSGLPDLQVDDTRGFLTPDALKTELSGSLSAEDFRLVKLLYAVYDNGNFLSYLKSKESALNPLGNLTKDDWEQLVSLMEETEHPRDERLLPYILCYYRTTQETDAVPGGLSSEDYLSGLYYDYAMKSGNKFLSDWFEFNLDLNNLLTAVACRKHDLDRAKFIIGDNETAKSLRQSNARDFGVGMYFEQADVVLRIAEEPDLLEREKKVDALKWAWLGENSFFHYFSVEKILAFVIKIQILERWKPLSMESGAAIFRELLASLKQGIEFKE